MKQIILFFILISTPFCFSQVLNIEKFRPQVDTLNAFMGNAELGFSGKKQRLSTQSFNTDVNAAYLSKKHSYLLLSTLSFNKVEDTEVTNEGYVHFRMNFYRRKFMSFEQFNQIQFDAGRGLEERKLTGVAFRFNFLRSDKMNLSINTGAMYEAERWFNSEEIDKPINNEFLKLSNSINFRYKVNKTTTFSFIGFYQSRPISFFKPRITLDSYLKVGVSKKIAIGLQYNMTYDTKPPLEIARLIYSYRTNLVYKF